MTAQYLRRVNEYISICHKLDDATLAKLGERGTTFGAVARGQLKIRQHLCADASKMITARVEEA